MNEFDKMKLRGEEFKENEFLRAYNNAPESIRRAVLCALGIHDELEINNKIEQKCRIYDFSSFVKKC